MFVVGDILGAGIYALVGEVGAEVGGAIWAAFTAALLLAVLTAFAYAELVTKYPQAAGSALYVDRAYKLSFFTFMVGSRRARAWCSPSWAAPRWPSTP